MLLHPSRQEEEEEGGGGSSASGKQSGPNWSLTGFTCLHLGGGSCCPAHCRPSPLHPCDRGEVTSPHARHMPARSGGHSAAPHHISELFPSPAAVLVWGIYFLLGACSLLPLSSLTPLERGHFSLISSCCGNAAPASPRPHSPLPDPAPRSKHGYLSRSTNIVGVQLCRNDSG